MAARLLEGLFDMALGMVAWHYRWNFMDENYGFVGREFGRSFRPQGSDDELDHYGNIIAERMEGKRAGMGDSAALRFRCSRRSTSTCSRMLEAHFTSSPLSLRRAPEPSRTTCSWVRSSATSRAIPEPSRLMKQRAPRVFRWTEHMNTPEIASPEFPETPAEFLADDAIPETTLALLRTVVDDAAAELVESARLYNEWAAQNADRPAGALVSDKDMDEPAVGRFETEIRGVPRTAYASVYPLWVWQRTLRWLDGLGASERAAAEALAKEVGALPVIELELARPLTRVRSRMAVA